jgi:tRNA threonylcarbamoyl adenosine modification protein YeaZ
MPSALALHTTTAELGLAISNLAGEVRWQTWEVGRSLSTHLHSYLAEFLPPQSWSDLAFLAVAQGPGSFTSTRIGMVTARTLAQQLNIPLFAISTLAAFAEWSRSQDPANLNGVDLAIQMPAQRGEFFVAVYPDVAAGIIENANLADTVMTADQWQQILQTWPRPYQMLEAGEGLATSVVSLLELAQQRWQRGDRPEWQQALPFYGQSSVV